MPQSLPQPCERDAPKGGRGGAGVAAVVLAPVKSTYPVTDESAEKCGHS